MGEEQRRPMGAIRAFIFRFLVWLLRLIEFPFVGGTISTIQTGSPPNNQNNVPLPLTAIGSGSPNSPVNGYVFLNGNKTYADASTTSAGDGSWTLHWNNANLSHNTVYQLKTFIVSTSDPAACLTSFRTMP